MPVEIGKYKSEIFLQERVMFEEKITSVKEIMQDIILTEKKLLLSKGIIRTRIELKKKLYL
ncbi:hypothetical protein G5716_30345 [Bacillus pacificus]|nr:hypothetical protein [Bacillus pacificus]